MELKRKRSASELGSSPSSMSSTFSPFTSPSSIAFSNMTLSDAPAPTPLRLHMHSRTLKRLRNNRPSDAQVHEHTMNLLYSARPHPATAVNEPAVEQPSPPASSASHQQSLHRFWNIASAPTAAPCMSQPVLAPSGCDDCGASLGGGNAVDVEDHACGACGKHVCFSCSVSNLGEQKRCLQCAGRKVGAGGGGWCDGAMSIC